MCGCIPRYNASQRNRSELIRALKGNPNALSVVMWCVILGGMNFKLPGYRTSEFRIGSIHGKAPSVVSREAVVRNFLYGVGMLILEPTRTARTRIRLVGYEVPIFKRGPSRDECIDLLGYDESFAPVLIELKKSRSSEPILQVIDQVNRYAEAFEKGIRNGVETEIRSRFLWPEFRFIGPVRKLILSGRDYYEGQTIPFASDVTFCSYARCRSEESLIAEARDEVTLAVIKQPRS